MHHRFRRWALLAILLLLISSAIGIAVRGIIQPHRQYDYYSSRY